MAVIPWGVIISALPSLVDTASRLFKKAEAPPEPSQEVSSNYNKEEFQAVIKRLEYLESLESEQAKLFQQTIAQLQNISMLASLTARRANIAMVIAFISVAVSVFSLFFSR